MGGAAQTGEHKYYSANDHLALQVAMDQIARRLQCTVTLDSAPVDPDDVTVNIAGETLAHVDSCDEGDGWRYTTTQAPYNSIELCGQACDQFREVQTLDADYSCPPEG